MWKDAWTMCTTHRGEGFEFRVEGSRFNVARLAEASHDSRPAKSCASVLQPCCHGWVAASSLTSTPNACIFQCLIPQTRSNAASRVNGRLQLRQTLNRRRHHHHHHHHHPLSKQAITSQLCVKDRTRLVVPSIDGIDTEELCGFQLFHWLLTCHVV